MSKERFSVREWQERFRAGEFNEKDVGAQMNAGWYDWFCRDSALAGRLQRIAPVVMGITEPAILDNYFVCFGVSQNLRTIVNITSESVFVRKFL